MGMFDSTKALLETLRTAHETMTKAQVAEAVLKVQGELLDAQEKIAALREERDEAKAKLAAADAWNKRASCYDLHDFFGDRTNIVRVFNVVKGKAVGIDEVSHYACPNCFATGRISLMHDPHTDGLYFDCRCGYKVQAQKARPPSIDIPSFDDDRRFI